jgi:hypothetical protein
MTMHWNNRQVVLPFQSFRGEFMRKLNVLVPAIAAAALAFGTAVPSPAQVGIGVNIGPAPACPYGYYEVPPYNCAPYGYYGPEWFSSGVFVGAGPWFHGRHGFYGHVDNRYGPEHYRGPYPNRGEHFDSHRDFHEFHGNSMRDGRGHERGH